MNYALVGPGKMGRAIDRVARQRGHLRVAELGRGATVDRDALGGADVAFEFTRAEAAPANLRALVEAGVATVCGTTGWDLDPGLAQRLQRATSGVVLAPNFSVGVNLFFRLVEHAARLLAPSGLYDPFVLEAHHRAKRDAPSGTARRLAQSLLDSDPRRTRVVAGNPEGRLADDAIQVACVRAGDEPGTHVVGFEGPHERIVLEHRARSRDGFALGAVLAAEWLGQRAGLYRFEDCLEGILDAAASATRAGSQEERS